ncbi:MAG: hypothetical protein HYY00_01915 [Chloroflexi bacterium]|nr:hypothetical protein [Chloroflexota bacterium]
MRINATKAKLRDGKAVIGVLLGYNAPWLVEMMAAVGFDFVVIDVEHEPFNDESVADLIRIADGAGLTPIVRMPCNERLVPFLDVGAQGVQVPQIEGPEHARRVVEMTRFYPLGRRTYYTQGRAARYGVGVDESEWTRRANEELLVIGMIEDLGAVEHLDKILSVQGIDAFHIGPLDLAQSMGYPPREELDRTIDEVVRQCRAAGKAVALGAVAPWGLRNVGAYAQKGVQIFNVASGWLLAHTLSQFLEEVRRQVPEEKRSWVTGPRMAHNPYMANRQ